MASISDTFFTIKEDDNGLTYSVGCHMSGAAFELTFSIIGLRSAPSPRSYTFLKAWRKCNEYKTLATEGYHAVYSLNFEYAILTW